MVVAVVMVVVVDGEVDANATGTAVASASENGSTRGSDCDEMGTLWADSSSTSLMDTSFEADFGAAGFLFPDLEIETRLFFPAGSLAPKASLISISSVALSINLVKSSVDAGSFVDWTARRPINS